MSSSSVPRLYGVIPIMDKLTQALDNFPSDSSLLPAIRAAATRGRVVLNKYYSLTDDSIMYRLAIREFI
jgi:hypothetical protein